MDRQTFQANAKKKIDEVFTKIDELEAKRDNAKAENKAKYDAKIAELKGKKNELQTKYNELVNATEANWEKVKNAFTASTDHFKQGFKEITALF